MKKLLTIFMFTLIFAIGIQQTSHAADGDIELVPYDQIACLNAEPECTRTKVGDANWDISYNGYNYNVAGGQARYVADFDDANFNGFIDALEMNSVNNWGSFGGIIVNDTASDVVLETVNARTDLTSIVHRIYVYFDENGDLAMLEDHYVTKHYIFNDGDAVTPDWRLATQAEIDIYDAADPKPDDTQLASIRIALDDVDTDGYKVEPLGYLKWEAAGVDVGVDAVEDWSQIIAGNPNYVTIPAGWTVLSLGTLDRDGSNPKTVEFVQGLPEALVLGTAAPMVATYTDQPGWFSGLTAHDDDGSSAGVNMVVDYNGTFDLPNDINAIWLNMFDDTSGLIINTNDMIDYSVVIAQDGVDLETIDFVWDGTVYTPSAAVTMVDTSEFGSLYTATYMMTTPEGDMSEVVTEIVIGVMPPKFAGVADVYMNEGLYIDLSAGITADDGYGNDKTDSIIITAPAEFNTYAPLPGVYAMELEFTHHVHFDGIDPIVDLNGTSFIFDGTMNAVSTDWDSLTSVYDDPAAVQALPMSWGSSGVLIEVAGDGTVIRTYNRHNWDLVDVNGFTDDGSGTFDAWLAALTFEVDGFLVAVGYNEDGYADAQALVFGDAVSYDLTQVDVFDYDIVTTEAFTVTVDDITAPQVMAVKDHYILDYGEFTYLNSAILSNVVAFDAYDSIDDLAVYISDTGGLVLTIPGTYTVEVTAEDAAGNSSVVTFDITVLEEVAEITQADIDAAVDAAIAALVDEVREDAEIQALIDAALEAADANIEDETGCSGSIGNASAFIIFGIAAVLGGTTLFFIRKP